VLAVTDPGQVFGGIVAAVNAGRILAYLPQMRAAATCPNGARSVSTLTWCYFALSHATVSVYSGYALHDFLLAAIFLGNCLACLALVGIVCWKRRQTPEARGVEITAGRPTRLTTPTERFLHQAR
jgi:hypothetical protein